MQRRAVLAGHSSQAGTSHAQCSRSPPPSHPACINPCVSLPLNTFFNKHAKCILMGMGILCTESDSRSRAPPQEVMFCRQLVI